MRISKKQLERIIKEELRTVLVEQVAQVAAAEMAAGRIPWQTGVMTPGKQGRIPGRVRPGGKLDLGRYRPIPGEKSGLPGRGGRGGYGHHWKQLRHTAGTRNWRGIKIGGRFMGKFSRAIRPITRALGPLAGLCGSSPWAMAGCAAVGAGIISYLAWKNYGDIGKGSYSYNINIDPFPEPMFPLTVACAGGKPNLYIFPTKQDRQKFMDYLEEMGGDPDCKGYVPPEERPQGPEDIMTRDPEPEAPKGKSGMCQFHVPPRSREEYDCFYRELHYFGDKSSLDTLTKYGVDYKWKDEHTKAYFNLLRKGYEHDFVPTHEDLEKYPWYRKVPNHIKNFFMSGEQKGLS